jgi:hypothetical protein
MMKHAERRRRTAHAFLTKKMFLVFDRLLRTECLETSAPTHPFVGSRSLLLLQKKHHRQNPKK